ncbi:hypothetical protein [Aquisphaera insulae]|uniref:hypothetical protein n=1 Tax=Aquisphaera insulae TaxID=2712864 RepID=UPI0013ED11BE|nr:hypothetical protein [Aquisphaera insulae]
MPSGRHVSRRKSFLILGFLAGSVAGCASDRFGGPPPDSTNVVQRPVYPVPGTKPLYIGGYAGAYYGPTRFPGR